MLKIGDFSRLANITIKALRHYDELGLLRPVYTDKYNGYRYYQLEQLPRLNRILALKDLGFSLEQVNLLINEELPVERLQFLLSQHQRQLHTQIQEEQQRLERVAARLRQIEHEGCLPAHEVLIKTVPDLWVTSRALTVLPGVRFSHLVSSMQKRLQEWTREHQLVDCGPWMLLQQTMRIQEEDNLSELACGVTAARNKKLAALREDQVNLRVLPGSTQMASVVHSGSRESLSEAYTSLYSWSEHNGFFVVGTSREICLNENEEKTDCRVTEVQVPLESIEDRKHKFFTVTERKESDFGPKFERRAAFMAVGMRYYGNNEDKGIGRMWGEFNKRMGEIEHTTGKMESFGLCSPTEPTPEGNFEYIASLEVIRAEHIPEGMTLRFVPEQDYAVFTHVGKLDNLGGTYEYIFQTWLPQSGYAMADATDFELYTEEFIPGDEKSRFYIYIPIREAGIGKAVEKTV